jgi:two-component system sensor histidine kinase MtrB
MNRLQRSLKHSLATRVILSTVLLSLSVVSLVGSALYSRLADGIYATSLNSSLAESRYTFFNAEYQVLASQSLSVDERKKALAEFVVSTSTQGINEERREVIFVRTPTLITPINSYEMSSNIIKVSSIPADLRKQVQKSPKPQHAYALARYNNGTVVDSLFVGQRINIPTGGRYEVYIVFSLKSQSVTLDLIKNSLLITGIILVL